MIRSKGTAARFILRRPDVTSPFFLLYYAPLDVATSDLWGANREKQSLSLSRVRTTRSTSPLFSVFYSFLPICFSRIHSKAHKITGDSFELRNAIFHIGKKLREGHCTVVIKDAKDKKCNGYRMNDDNIDKATWTKNAFEAYILF